MERPKITNCVTGVATSLVGANMASSVASTTSSSSSSASSAAVDKRKKLEETSKESRIDAQQVIDDLIKSANLEHDVHDQGIIDHLLVWSLLAISTLFNFVCHAVSGLQLKDITQNAQSNQWDHGKGKVYGSIWWWWQRKTRQDYQSNSHTQTNWSYPRNGRTVVVNHSLTCSWYVDCLGVVKQIISREKIW